MRVLMIIPAYNEEESIVQTVQQIESYREFCDFTLDYVIINDGSTDKTQEILDRYEFNHVQLVLNLGIGGAVQTGYKYALENGYDIAVQFDGDGQHDICSLKELIQPLVEGKANLSVGSRFVGGSKSGFQTTFMRRFGIKIISTFILLTTGKKILDTTSGYRAADQRVINYFARRYPTKYPEPESMVHLLKRGFNIVETPVNMFERQGGESSITPIKSIRYMCEVCSSILVTALMKEGD